tara:strand:+ start:678 stop:983 length:306 start_codon:yes stop_codon:yes gene_type:complete
MIRYIVKSVDNIPITGTINNRISCDNTQIIVKFEIDLDNLSSLLKADLKSLADSMAINYSSSETKSVLISKINEKVKTQIEMREYIRENTDFWNPEPGAYS